VPTRDTIAVVFRLLQDAQPSDHKRILSDASTMTDVSETFSALSCEPQSDSHDVAGLDVAAIPWDHGKGNVLTVDLALFCLILLAQEDRHLSDQYDSLEKSEKDRIPAHPTQQDKRRRESESEGDPQRKTQKRKGKEFFVPRASIHEDVISADIEVYIPGANVRSTDHQGQHGFMIEAPEAVAFERDELVSMLSDLKADTAKWNQKGVYKDSKVYKARHNHGGSYKRS
jgi:hypothetical protein